MNPARLLAAGLLTLTALPAAAGLHVAEMPLVTEAHDQKNPVVFGSRMVFEDYRADGIYADLYHYDFTTMVVTPYATGAQDQWFPAIWGDLIAWMDNRPGVPGSPAKSDIFYSFSPGQQTNLTNDTLDQWWPAVSRGYVFWEEGLSLTRWNIVGALAGAGGRFPVAEPTLEAHEVSAAYPWVVYKELAPETEYDVWAANLATGERFLVSGAPEDQQFPHTDGRYVVWEDTRSAATGSDIYLFDLRSRTERPLCTNASTQEYPRVWGNLVVWMDWRSGRCDIYGHDLATGQEFPVCVASGDQLYPAIHGNRVVWQDKRNGNFDIYGAVVTRDYALVGDIAQAKMLPDGAEVELHGRTVTANFGGEASIEDPDRNSGIRVTGAWEVSEGQVVTVRGVMATARGEREIAADIVQVTGSTQPLQPYLIGNRNLGGKGFAPVIPEIEGPEGLVHNAGLLAQVWGIVTTTGSGWFYVDDGSGLADGSGNTGVRVSGDGNPPAGKFVRVTGIVSAFEIDNQSRPCIRTRSAADVTVMDP